jgi:hypothetical protein
MAKRYDLLPLIERWILYQEHGSDYAGLGMNWPGLQACAIAEMERCSVYSSPPLKDPRGCPPILQRLRDERDSHFPLQGPGYSGEDLIADVIDELERLALWVPPILYPSGEHFA